MELDMRYRFYLQIKLQDDNWKMVGEYHEIQWDYRDLIKASSGWHIINRERVGQASDFVPKLRRGIIELRESADAYKEFELSLGLGTIKNVLSFYESLLNDCEKYPYTELFGSVAG